MLGGERQNISGRIIGSRWRSMTRATGLEVEGRRSPCTVPSAVLADVVVALIIISTLTLTSTLNLAIIEDSIRIVN